MIALLKVPDCPPSVVVLDSFNLKIDQKNDASRLLSFFYEEYIRQPDLGALYE
ncbi:hypothetical protein H0W26_01640 [Candidatus Dependentiae bacterium]|nr:hypothetical protein [Candidatus Dependentiae bacterium]